MIETKLLEEHRAAGAHISEWQEILLPEKFSSFDAEYRAAKESVALFDTGWNAILLLTGRDRVKYLHAISSNNIQALAEGQGALALLLNPQGRIQAEIEVYALPEKLLVLSHASLRERTVALLKKYVIGSQVKIEDLTDQWGSFAIEGPQAAPVVQEVLGIGSGEMPEMTAREITIDGISCLVARRSHFGAAGIEVLAPREELVALWRKALRLVREGGGEPIGMAALNSLRLEAGVPWFPDDFNDGMIPHEAAVETTHISFNKGCYTGQEIVERVRSRGHVNKKRVLLKFSGPEPPQQGTKLRAGGDEIGFVTSAAASPASGAPIGMGYLRREQFAAESIVEFDGGTAKVQASKSTSAD